MTSPFDAAYAAWQAEAVKDGASCTTCLQAAIAAYEVAAPSAALRDEDVYRLNDTVWRDNPAESIAEAKQRLAPELEWDHPPVCPKCNALMWGEGESRVGVDRQRCRTCGFVRPVAPPAGGTPPLDLRAAEARLTRITPGQIVAFGAGEGLPVRPDPTREEYFALLAHCRALRAKARQLVEESLNNTPPKITTMAELEGVLAQATDEATAAATTSELLTDRPVVVARDWRTFVNDVGARAHEEARKVSPSDWGPEYWEAYTDAFNRLFDSALVLHTDKLVEKGAAHVADAALRHLNALRVAHGEPPLHLARPEP